MLLLNHECLFSYIEISGLGGGGRGDSVSYVESKKCRISLLLRDAYDPCRF